MVYRQLLLGRDQLRWVSQGRVSAVTVHAHGDQVSAQSGRRAHPLEVPAQILMPVAERRARVPQNPGLLSCPGLPRDSGTDLSWLAGGL